MVLKSCYKCGVQKELSMFHKLSRAKDGHQNKCKECALAAAREWHSKNKDRAAALKKENYKKNKDSIRRKNSIWLSNNHSAALGYGKKYRSNNAEKERARSKRYRELHKAEASAYRKAYNEANAAGRRYRDAKRRANEKKATPDWANEFFIKEAYVLAEMRRKVCGGDWHVDHIVPIQSDIVCGLHVEHNLQVIPASINHSKSNRWWPNMPSSDQTEPPTGGFFIPESLPLEM